MRALRNCDFCADDAVGAFEIVPPELEPTEAEQRRVVCCSDCSERLETLLEPLLARVGAETDDESTAIGSGIATTDDSRATRSRTASSNATVSDGAADASDHSDAGEAGSDAAGDDSDSTEDEPNTAASREGGITFERDERPTDTETAEDGETANEVETTTAPGTATEVDADDRSESAVVSSDEDSPSASTRPPETYRKVIRLLRNREFPMTRSAVEELAAGAYDLERHEAEALVDHAVENGEFVEEQKTLRRP
ncbi:hypothetical protein [Natrinema soli]|uniref:Uncharacterized protein n=1 Tax=Natrinema soli TaxID=1930624 RepID=A0ABD5T035_9EURY|nr:hypothetical protein [Natrinema soli]